MTQQYNRSRTTVNVGIKDLRRNTEQCTEALLRRNNPPRIFQQGGVLVTVDVLEDGTVLTRQMTVDAMVREISEAANCCKAGKAGKDERPIPQFPPVEVARNILAKPDQGFPVLKAVVRTPVYTADGRLIAVPGYDEASGIDYIPVPGSGLEGVTKRINTNKLNQAVECWRELLSDFPFLTQSAFAHCIVVALLPLVRPMIQGQTPIHAFNKPMAGLGATLLAETLSYPALGFPVPRVAAPGDESEWSRTIQAVLAGMPQVFLIDNVADTLKSAALASAVTSPTIMGRKIRTSDAAKVPVNCVWIVTGINITTSPEIGRRTIMIRLHSNDAHPELRTGFKIPNLQVYVRQHQADLLVALLTMIQAWIDEGRPRSEKVFGGFEEYAAIMGGILDTAGISGFLEGIVRPPVVKEVDQTAWETFVCEWFGAYQLEPVTSKALAEVARQAGLLPPSGTATQLGTIISGHLGEQVECFVVGRGTKQHGDNRWVLQEAAEAVVPDAQAPDPATSEAVCQQESTKDEDDHFNHIFVDPDDLGFL
jgi:hypothetical protein